MHLPEVPAPHLAEWWFDLGLCGAEGPLAWQEIAAWQRFHAPITGWEAKVIRRMSEAYCAQRETSRTPDCPPPFSGGEPEADVNERVTRQFAAMVAGIRAARGETPTPS